MASGYMKFCHLFYRNVNINGIKLYPVPGYGFLSENARFAEAVYGAGLTWVSPPPEPSRSWATRCRRHVAARAGLPTLPSAALDGDDAEQPRRIGPPVWDGRCW